MSQTMYIIDGHYHCFKSFFALPHMTNSAGEPTQVVFGIAKLAATLRRLQPDYLVFAFDSPGKTFRHNLYPEYKANREAAPDEFKVQIPAVFELLQTLAIPVAAREGYEADDIIATLARQAAARGIAVRIESRDKDLYQLLNDSISLYEVSSDTMFTAASLKEKWGISPAQVKDFLRLTGDSSDNIPGIPGIGPKTASKLLEEFGSIDTMLTRLDEIKGAKKTKISENRANLDLSDRLVTLDTAVPLDQSIDDFSLQKPDTAAVTVLFQRLDFGSLMPDLPAAVPVEAPREATEYILVDSLPLFDSMMSELGRAPLFALDIETTGLDPHTDRIVGLSFSAEPCKGWYLPFPAEEGHPTPLTDGTCMSRLKTLLADPAASKVGQNLKFDYKFLTANGIRVGGYAFDTMIASYLLNPGAGVKHNLSSLAKRLLGHTMIELEDIGARAGDGTITMQNTAIGDLAAYACEDADITLRLCGVLKPQIEAAGLGELLETVEIPVAQILGEMEWNGVYVDADMLRAMSADFAGELETLTAQIYELAGEEFNHASPKQLATILFEKLGLPVQKKTKTGFSTDESVLKALAFIHPLPGRILEARSLAKLKNTYVDVLPEAISTVTGRIHPEFNQVVTATGRLSSSNPNLQNIPVRTDRGRRVREAFTAQEPGALLLTADYSQIELRMLAHYSGDANLVQSFREGLDIHRATAARLNDVAPGDVTDEMRYQAKTVNFGIIYGQTAYGLAQATGMAPGDAKQFIERYFGMFPGIKTFMDTTIERACETGEVRTILNRRRPVPELKSRNRNEQQAGMRVAVNTVIQGSAADLIKMAMVAIRRQIQAAGLQARMIMQIHDELVFELPAAEREPVEHIVRRGMEHAMELTVPLVVNTGSGRTWMEIH